MFNGNDSLVTIRLLMQTGSCSKHSKDIVSFLNSKLINPVMMAKGGGGVFVCP